MVTTIQHPPTYEPHIGDRVEVTIPDRGVAGGGSIVPSHRVTGTVRSLLPHKGVRYAIVRFDHPQWLSSSGRYQFDGGYPVESLEPLPTDDEPYIPYYVEYPESDPINIDYLDSLEYANDWERYGDGDAKAVTS